MNANEFIERYGKALYGEGEIDLAETYDLLRQQQADITALKCLSNLDMKTKIKQQARITELEEQCLAFQNSAIDLAKQLDKKFPEREELPNNCAKTEEITRTGNMNEPVAELVLEQMAVGDASSLRVNWLMDGYPPVGTKLYTHPAKTLTNEEIDDALSAAFNRGAMFGYAEGLKKVSSQAFTRRLKLFPRAGKKNKSFIGMLRGGK